METYCFLFVMWLNVTTQSKIHMSLLVATPYLNSQAYRVCWLKVLWRWRLTSLIFLHVIPNVRRDIFVANSNLWNFIKFVYKLYFVTISSLNNISWDSKVLELSRAIFCSIQIKLDCFKLDCFILCRSTVFE